MVRWILFVYLVGNATSISVADIWQWTDGDNNGSLWLSSSLVEPNADLSNQVLWWADLPFTNLHHANLVNTDLSYANLFGANLKIANLSNANLFDANLENSILAYASFFGATLESANIGDANMFYADFSNANLSGLENWESAFWLAARYNANTIFPDGMDPNDYAMIELEVPAPAAGIFLTLLMLNLRKRNLSILHSMR